MYQVYNVESDDKQRNKTRNTLKQSSVTDYGLINWIYSMHSGTYNQKAIFSQ